MADQAKLKLTNDDLLEMYRLMLLARRFTESVLQWYTQGRVAQGLHPSIGQEAVGVGACYGLRAGDWVLPSLRTAEAFWTRGVTVLEQFNAMMGNAQSVSAPANSSKPAPRSDQSQGTSAGDQKVKASPALRRLASRHGISLETVQGTGPGGRITKEDLQRAIDLQET